MSTHKTLNIRDFGPSANDSKATTAAIQACLDTAAQRGGGSVIVPKGHWSVGSLNLHSGLELRLESGAHLDGRVQIHSAADVKIIGQGPQSSQLTNLRCANSQQLLLEGFGGCELEVQQCRQAQVRGLKLHKPPQRQAEGSALWLYDVEDMEFSDLDLACNDDVFCIKHRGRNISLTRAVLHGRLAAAFKIGTETGEVIENISFTDSLITHSDRAALSLESVDGTRLRHVRIRNIRMVNVAAPLFVRLGNRDRFATGMGSIDDVVIQDVEAVGMGLDEGYGSSITGLPGHPVGDITLERCRFTYRGGVTDRAPVADPPELADRYPEYDMFGKLPAWGLWCRHVQGLQLRDVALRTVTADSRPALLCDDVADLHLDTLDAQTWPAASFSTQTRGATARYRYPDPQPPSQPAIELRNARKARLRACNVVQGAALLRLRGQQTGQVTLSQCQTLPTGAAVVEMSREVTSPPQSDLPLTLQPIGPWIRSAPTPDALIELTTPPGVRLQRDGRLVQQFDALPPALRAAQAGDRLVILPGHYRLQPGEYPLVLDKPGITLCSAAGPALTRLTALGASEHTWRNVRSEQELQSAILRVSLVALLAGGTGVQGLTLGGALLSVYGRQVEDCIVRQNVFDFSKRYHVLLQRSRRCSIEGNQTRAALLSALQLEDCGDCTIRDNVLREESGGLRLLRSCGNHVMGNHFDAPAWHAMMIEHGSHENRIMGNRIENGRICGIQVRGADRVLIQDNLLRGMRLEAVLVDSDSHDLRIQGNSFEANRSLAVSNETPATIDARDNWWGNADGPSEAGPGSGDMVDQNVLFEPWLKAPRDGV